MAGERLAARSRSLVARPNLKLQHDGRERRGGRRAASDATLVGDLSLPSDLIGSVATPTLVIDGEPSVMGDAARLNWGAGWDRD
jgi:hypothetical protein